MESESLAHPIGVVVRVDADRVAALVVVLRVKQPVVVVPVRVLLIHAVVRPTRHLPNHHARSELGYLILMMQFQLPELLPKLLSSLSIPRPFHSYLPQSSSRHRADRITRRAAYDR